MKKFFPFLIVAAVAAIIAAIFFFQPKAPSEPVADTNVYQNDQYKFGFTYPKNLDVRVREDENRQTDYLGMPVDFFISLRDVEREEKPVTLAVFYASPTLSIDAFKTALEASDPASVKVTATEELSIGGLAMTKVTSTTAIELPKTHYLFDREGQTVIVSVILQEEANFAPVLETFTSI